MLNFSTDRAKGKAILEYIKNENFLYSLKKQLEGAQKQITGEIRVPKEKYLQELRDSFLRNVSHELRTPLTSVIGFLDLVFQERVGKINSKQKEFLKIALNNTKNLKKLTQKGSILLNMS